jgi:phosphate-selective porin OprO and OprP
MSRRHLLAPLLLPLLLAPRVVFAQDAPPPLPPTDTEPPPTPPPPPTSPPPTDAQMAPTTAPSDAGEPSTSNDRSALAADGYPMAGFHNGLFYLRDYNDNFRLHLQGRAQVDFYSYAGPGVADVANLKPTVFLRRIRPELSGEIVKDWAFMIAGDFGATALDNASGNATETRAAAPGATPSATSGTYAGAQTTRFQAAATDVFLNYRAHPLLNLQFGQFDANFTMENRTSDKYFPFIERSLAVRVVGIPTNKDIGAMAWGELESKLWFWSLGLYNGDGQNKLNTDSRGDLMLRTFIHPLTNGDDPVMKNLQVGGSFRYGSRDHKWTNYDYPAMTTQANYQFWKPTYAGADGPTHILPSGDQIGAAGELRIPISMFDLTSEFVYIKNNTREALEGYQASNTQRFGDMKGYSYYVMLGFWPLGNRDVNGLPGYENIAHVDFKKPDPATAKQALQLLVKWEQLALTYSSASRDGAVDAKNIDGDIKVNAFSLGANFWATKHIRLSANYVLNMFPDSAPTSATAAGGPVQSSNNRAIAPGNTLGAKVNDDARDNAHTLHEIIFRAAVAL